MTTRPIEVANVEEIPEGSRMNSITGVGIAWN